MKDKEITIPADVDSVSLRIERPAIQDQGPTLRGLIMSTKCANEIRIMIKESVHLKDDTTSEFYWSLTLPSTVDSVENRRRRVEMMACATLCDCGVLLDEREVTIGRCDSALVFTVEANPDD